MKYNGVTSTSDPLNLPAISSNVAPPPVSRLSSRKGLKKVPISPVGKLVNWKMQAFSVERTKFPFRVMAAHQKVPKLII